MDKHSNCLNFSPIDAAKGICRISNGFVNIDGETCTSFKLAPKCSNCENFKNVNEENIGTCIGLGDHAWSFGELSAITCEGYEKCL